jgi:hypothetical protein
MLHAGICKRQQEMACAFEDFEERGLNISMFE